MNPDSLFREVLESHEFRPSDTAQTLDVGLPEFLRLRTICFQYLACVAFLKPIQGM
jgi:hypothetical protein